MKQPGIYSMTRYMMQRYPELYAAKKPTVPRRTAKIIPFTKDSK